MAGTFASSDAHQPHTLTALFDGAFTVYRQHFGRFALCAATLYLPIQLLLRLISDNWLAPLSRHIGDSAATADSGSLFSYLLGRLLIGVPETLVPGLIALLAMLVVGAPICMLTADAAIGRSSSLGDAMIRAIPHTARLVTAWICAILALIAIEAGLMAVLVFGVALFEVTIGHNLGPLAAFTLLLCGTIGGYTVCMALVARSFLFITPLIVLEGRSISAAWERNAQLVGRPRMRSAWAAAVFLPIVYCALQLAVQASITWTVNMTSLPPLLYFIVLTGSTTTVFTVFLPYPTIVMTLLYLDFRFRREGLDIRWSAQAADTTVTHQEIRTLSPQSGAMGTQFGKTEDTP
jgi:hypothetical protein